ncbi:MAG: hypothetical protein IKS96_01380 [Fibrobacter sp.]|nr:hypothetical protein [Fibrobacter sp.]
MIPKMLLLLLGVASFAMAEKCADVIFNVMPNRSYYNHGYVAIQQNEYETEDGKVLEDDTFKFNWVGTSSANTMKSVDFLNALDSTENFSKTKEQGSYATYKETGNVGEVETYSSNKLWSKGTIDYSGDTVLSVQFVYGEKKTARVDSLKMYKNKDTLFISQISFSGYPDTVAYLDTTKAYFVDNPEKENSCIRYNYNSDSTKWNRSGTDISYSFNGDTLIYTESYVYFGNRYNKNQFVFVPNSVLFNEQTININDFKRVRPSNLLQRKNYYDLKGRRYLKKEPYRVQF